MEQQPEEPMVKNTLDKINEYTSNQRSLMCLTRKEFEKNKKIIYNHKAYLTHFYYRTDCPSVGVCLRKLN